MFEGRLNGTGNTFQAVDRGHLFVEFMLKLLILAIQAVEVKTVHLNLIICQINAAF